MNLNYICISISNEIYLYLNNIFMNLKKKKNHLHQILPYCIQKLCEDIKTHQ